MSVAAAERKIELKAPFPWQVEVLDSPARFKVCFVGRRAGKSDLALLAALCGHGPRQELRGAIDGGHVWWVLPSFTLAVEAWDRLTFATRTAATRTSQVEKRVTLPGGGSVAVKSSDNHDSLRGVGLHGAILDELKDHGPKVWSEALRPTLSDHQGWGLMLGTPGKIGSWSHELFSLAPKLEGWATWQLPSRVNPLLHQAELDDAKRTQGSTVFSREYEAKFVSDAGAIFKREWFRFFEQGARGYMLDGQLVERDRLRIFATADLAATVKTFSDYSAIGVFGVAPDGRILVLEVLRRKLEGHEFLPAFRDLVDRWQLGSVFVEATAYNNLFMGIARAEGIPIRELVADRDKFARAEPAIAALEGGRVWLPSGALWARDFLNELCEFSPDPKERGHDDQVDVLSYAVAVAAKAQPRFVRPAPRERDEGKEGSWQIGR